MAHKKAAGVSKNGRDSGPRYLGIKVADGSDAKIGSIIVRQAGRNVVAGKNIGVGKDHTLFALKDGKVKFTSKRKQNFDSTMSRVRVANIV
ncbi:MAG: 50S ribosomal protein L27 [Candidatus Paceibacterota bacterium]|jgi:large subunit ribosomal protein L27